MNEGLADRKSVCTSIPTRRHNNRSSRKTGAIVTRKYDVPTIDYDIMVGYKKDPTHHGIFFRLKISTKVLVKTGVVALRMVYFGGLRRIWTSNKNTQNELTKTGIKKSSLEPEILKEINAAIYDQIFHLKNARVSVKKRTFSDNQTKILDPCFSLIKDALLRSREVQSLLKQTEPWFNRNSPAEIARITLQINDASDIHIHSSSETSRATDYMHIDAAIGQLKFILYISDVGIDNGPTCYVPETNMAHGVTFKRLIAAAVDNCGLSSQSEPAKVLFINLPRWLRFKATFGNDLPKKHPDYRFLLDKEEKIVGHPGTIFLFDPSGVHRGGLIKSGERIILQIQLRSV